jgi:hypothetical protein
MTRLLLLLATAATLIAAWTAGLSSAAFVDSTATETVAEAAHVADWLPQPGVADGGPCEDEDDDLVECSVEVEAKNPLPGGAASIAVRLTVAGSDASARAAAPVAEAVLTAGQRRRLSITLAERADLLVTAAPGSDASGFLSYVIPGCDGKPCGSGGGNNGGGGSTPRPPVNPKPPVTPETPGETPTTPAEQGAVKTPAPSTGAPTQVVAPSVDAQGTGAPSAAPARRCASRRLFTMRLPKKLRGKRVLAARVTAGTRRFKVKPSKRENRLTVAVDLRGLPKSTVRVVGVLRLAGGRSARYVRTFRTC